jgi:hypothetical protein
VIEVASRLAVDREQLWATISTMDGVNAELSPWLRMSVPVEVRGKSLAACASVRSRSRVGCWRWGSCRSIAIACVWSSSSADADSSSARAHGCSEFGSTSAPWRRSPAAPEIRDRVTFEPRIRLFAPLVRAVVTRLFQHRHARLRARFGVLATSR